MSLDILVPGRHFTRAVITWKIKNIWLAIASQQKIIDSADIILSTPFKTKWRLHLAISTSKDKVIMYLEMLSNESKRVRVKVNWVSYLSDGEDEEEREDDKERSLTQERQHSFEPNSKLAVQMFKIGNILKLLKVSSDELKIKCLMLVQFGLNPMIPKTRVEGVVSLSEDLSTLPRSFLHHDVLALVSKVQFTLHRAMLCYRSETLINLVKASSANLHVRLPFNDAKAAEAVFRYLYSGDLTYILSSPSLVISDYIERLRIPEIQNVYPKVLVNLESKIDGKLCSFIWKINDPGKATFPISGPVHYENCMESRWQLFLYQNRSKEGSEQETTAIYIEALLVESKTPLSVCLQFSTGKDGGKDGKDEGKAEGKDCKDEGKAEGNAEGKDCKGEGKADGKDGKDEGKVHSRTVYGRMNVGTKLGVSFFEEGLAEMEKFVTKNILCLCFSVHIAAGEDCSIIKDNTPFIEMPLNNERSLMTLSRIMGLLMKVHEHCDFLFEVEDQQFKAHKFLVAARSPILKDLLTREKDTVSLKLLDCKKDIFRVFLSYLYIGIIVENDPDKLMELYDMGDMYEVFSLQDVCADLLHKLLKKENVLRILVFADDRGETKLRARALEVLLEQGSSIKDDPYWYYFTRRKPKIHIAVEGFIA